MLVLSQKLIQKICPISNQMKNVKVRWRVKRRKKLQRRAARSKVTVNHLNQSQQLKLQKMSTSAPKAKKKSNLSWESKKFQPPQCDVPDISLKLKVNNRLKTTKAPTDFFNPFCDNNFFVQICQETNF